MRAIELLAPAGSRASLEAAVKAGADAVYLAGQQFGARRSATNFSEEELLEVIDYCHLRGVKVYMTVNTLLKQAELAELGDYLEPFYQGGLDAFIVQDLGVFSYLRARFKDIHLHCSTQMTLASSEDVRALLDLGANRVVMPRELHINDIKRIYEETGAEIEAFVHGALCVSVSGQCLMSSLIGGRSGNRGSCAQSCRQPYQMWTDASGKMEKVSSSSGDYLLSPRDLMTLDQMKQLIDNGVHSLKIEGRMKGPEYTFAVTRAYRMAIDALIKGSEADLEAAKQEIERVFNRDFTQGLVLGTSNKAYISQESPGNRGVVAAEVLRYDSWQNEVELKLLSDITKGDDLQARIKGNPGGRVEYIKVSGQRVESASKNDIVSINFKHPVKKGDLLFKTYDQNLMKQLQMTINDVEKRLPIHGSLVLRVGMPAVLELKHESGATIKVATEALVEKALKTPLSKERILEQLEKLGGTPYYMASCEIDHLGDETLPIKVLNQLRRDAVEALADQFLSDFKRGNSIKTELAVLEQPQSQNQTSAQISVMVRTEEQLRAALDLNIQRIYVNELWLSEALWPALQDERIVPYLGRFEKSQSLVNRLNQLKAFGEATGIKSALVSSIGQGRAVKALGFKCYGDFSLNIMNARAADLLAEEGYDGITLSLELNAEEIEALLSHFKQPTAIELIGYGRIPVMVTEYCPINGVYAKDKAGCQICRKGAFYIEDKTGAKFLVKGNAACQTEIFNSSLLNLADEWDTLDDLKLSWYRLELVTETYDEAIATIEEQLKARLGMAVHTKGQGYTKGHFRRGVL